jgi:hypothetical protein
MLGVLPVASQSLSFMLVYYFVAFIVSNRYLLFWVSNGHNCVTVQNRTHVYMNFFHHKDLGNHLLQLWHKIVKHSVCISTLCETLCFVFESFLEWISAGKATTVNTKALKIIPRQSLAMAYTSCASTYFSMSLCTGYPLWTPHFKILPTTSTHITTTPFIGK